MVEQPSGTVTLVFTDIEGSTLLLHELGEEAYREALAEHRRVVREACGRHGGYEVDYEGDSFFYAFSSASEAVAAVEQAMLGLAEGPIRLRVGIHTGQPGLDPPKYVGLEVHRAARIMSVGHGGQVLLSAATACLVEAPMRELGEHRLKDFDEPVSLFQLGEHPFPPLRTISNTNLPRPASNFLGREREVGEVVALLRDGARLVTLDGPGGSGKTRLAIEAAAELVGQFKAGVFWVGLAGVRDPSLVLSTIAQTLGAREALARHIEERELLLLLDNFEQVVAAAPDLAALVEACLNLRVLVTSRELLRVRGEVRYQVPPLEPADAVRLFCSRSQLPDSPEVMELCRRLDDLPLAVELAAARTSVLTPAQILERLSRRLDLFRGGRDANPRQRTLRATIEWSYDLLTDEERLLLRRLAVFAGGCTLEAAEQIAGGEFESMQSLVDKSLLRRTGERFWMLETIHEYAAERLQADAAGTETRRHHAAYHLALCEASTTAFREASPDLTPLMSRCDAEQDNLRAALAWSAEADSGILVRLVLAANHLWIALANPEREGDRWTELALARCPDDDAASKARLIAYASSFAEERGDLEQTLALRQEALTLYRQLGDRKSAAIMMRLLPAALLPLGRLAEARACQDEAMELARQLGDEGSFALALSNEGICLAWEGRFSDALVVLEDALARERALHWAPYIGWQLGILGIICFHQGKLVRAYECFTELLEMVRQPPQQPGREAARALVALAAISARQGKTIQAARQLASAERWLTENGRTPLPLLPWFDEAAAEARRAVVSSLGVDELARIEREIETMSIEEAVDEALGAAAFETVIRPGTPLDADAVARVHVRTWQAAYGHLFPATRLAELSVERRAKQWREWPPLVAVVNGVVVGFVSVGVSRDAHGAGELFAIYVDPEHWGTGVGRELIAAGEERLRQLGHANAILWVLEDNPRARRFYERASWHHDGATRSLEIFGRQVLEVRYRKELQIRSPPLP